MMDCSSFSWAGSSGSEVLNRSSGASIGADFFSVIGFVSALRSALAADFSELRDGRGSCLCRSAPQTVQKVCRVSIGSPQNGQRMIITSLITGHAGVQFTPLWIYYTPSVSFCQLFHSKIGISYQYRILKMLNLHKDVCMAVQIAASYGIIETNTDSTGKECRIWQITGQPARSCGSPRRD